jgi:tRNA (guanine-N7-)-methyltransferase
MGKNKIARFEENKKLPNVIQPTREEAINDFKHKGKWAEFLEMIIQLF